MRDGSDYKRLGCFDHVSTSVVTVVMKTLSLCLPLSALALVLLLLPINGLQCPVQGKARMSSSELANASCTAKRVVTSFKSHEIC